MAPYVMPYHDPMAGSIVCCEMLLGAHEVLALRAIVAEGKFDVKVATLDRRQDGTRTEIVARDRELLDKLLTKLRKQIRRQPRIKRVGS